MNKLEAAKFVKDLQEGLDERLVLEDERSQITGQKVTLIYNEVFTGEK